MGAGEDWRGSDAAADGCWWKWASEGVDCVKVIQRIVWMPLKWLGSGVGVRLLVQMALLDVLGSCLVLWHPERNKARWRFCSTVLRCAVQASSHARV